MFGGSRIEQGKRKSGQMSAAAGHSLGPWKLFTSDAAVSFCENAACVWSASAYEYGPSSSDKVKVPQCPFTAKTRDANTRFNLRERPE